jgi:hypothetical protein
MSRVVIIEIIGFYPDVEGGHHRDHRLSISTKRVAIIDVADFFIDIATG